MRGLIIFAPNGSVVFHSAPFSRDVVNSLVAVVESDVHIKASDIGGGQPSELAGDGEGGRSAFVSSKASAPSAQRHGGYVASTWLETHHREICEGTIVVFPDEHAWLQEAQEDVATLLYWRKGHDKIFIFVLSEQENLTLAKCAMSNLFQLLQEAFRSSKTGLPTLKDIASKPELVQLCYNCVAPQHLLALIDTDGAKLTLQKLLKRK